jgi:alpha-glucosidase
VWVLGNHDTPRLRTRYGGSERRSRAAAMVLLTLRGTPFLYAGDELGLLDGDVPADRRVDPGGRDGCRAPIPWTRSDGHGWTRSPWLPWPPDPGAHSVEARRTDADSILHLHRDLLRARRASAALHRGTWRRLDAHAGVLAYERRCGDDRRRIAINFDDEPTGIELDDHATETWTVELSSLSSRAARSWDGRLAGGEAVLLRPAGASPQSA